MIDWNHVDGLRADLGEGFDELVEVFLDEVDEAMSRLAPDIAPKQASEELHFLKGAALNLGFSGFAAICSAGEDSARAGGAVDFGPVRESLAASRRAFLDGLAARRVA